MRGLTCLGGNLAAITYTYPIGALAMNFLGLQDLCLAPVLLWSIVIISRYVWEY